MGYDFTAIKNPLCTVLPNNAREISPQIWETIYTHYYQLGELYYIIGNNSETTDFCINIHTAEQLRMGLPAESHEFFQNVFGGSIVSGAVAAELANKFQIALEQNMYPNLEAEFVHNFAQFLQFAGENGILSVS